MPPGLPDTAILPVKLNGRSYQLLLQQFECGFLPPQRPSTDQSQQPGEQSFNPEGSWFRSQTDWTHGGGQEVRDDDDGDSRRFYRQSNTHAVARGRIQLSNRLQVMSTTRGGAFYFSGTFWTERTVVQTGNSLFWWESSGGNQTLYRQSITAGPYGGAIAPATAIAATATSMNILATDGTATTWLARGGSGVSRATTETGAFTAAWSALPTNLIVYANGHLLGIVANSVWEFTTGGAVLGGASIFDHPNSNFIWQGGVAGAGRIYLWGASGNEAAVYVLYDVLSSSGSLAPPKIALPMPFGETVQHMEPIGGVFLMRTNLGLRLVTPNGDALEMGPLIVHRDKATDFPCLPTCISAAAGDYVMAAFRNPQGQPDFIGRVDMTRFIAEDVPALHPIEYLPVDGSTANMGLGPIKVAGQADTQFKSGQLWAWGGKTDFTTRRIWAVSLGATPNSDLSAREKATTGSVYSGWLTFNSTDPKQPVSVRVLHDPIPAGASLSIVLVGEDGTNLTGGSAVAGTTHTDVSFDLSVIGAQRQYQILLQFGRGTDTTTTPAVLSWATRAYPQPFRQEEIILPLMLKARVQGTGRGPTIVQDVFAEYLALRALAISQQPVTLVLGGVSTMVRVDDVRLPSEGVYSDREDRKWSGDSASTAPSPPGTNRFIEGVYHVRCLSVV